MLRDGKPGGLLVERPEGDATRESFRELTGSDDEYDAWRAFYADVSDLAQVVAPTLLSAAADRERRSAARSTPPTWRDLVEPPARRGDRGAASPTTPCAAWSPPTRLIGTFASMHDPSLIQNRCFLYHLIGNGTGEWRVPVGGMGAVTDALAERPVEAGAEIVTGAGVSAIDDRAATAPRSPGTTAPPTHAVTRPLRARQRRALGAAASCSASARRPDTSPRAPSSRSTSCSTGCRGCKSGVDPAVAFAGTLHLAEDYSQLEAAYADAAAGRVPAAMPGEVYCHSLTDPSILGDCARRAAHADLLRPAHARRRSSRTTPSAPRSSPCERALASLNEHLVDPHRDAASPPTRNGQPCIEAKIPQDIERDLAMPGGHIFHGDLEWPWAPNRARLETPAQRWGVQTDDRRPSCCAAPARAAVARSRASAATTRPRPCSSRSEPTAGSRFSSRGRAAGNRSHSLHHARH